MLEWRLTLALVAILVVPGWAILSLRPSWKEYATLARWCLAISLSIAFFPILFYATRTLVPSFQWGPNKIAILLIAGAAMIAWNWRSAWRAQFAFERLEWIAIAIFALTLFTRFWIIRDRPYPAWTDSLHHAILTQITAVSGRLPYDMQPYFPIPLGEYHLGLYALSGALEMLSGAPAHTALLWMAQGLNGLCGLGVYLVLDRRVGRVGAIVGAATVGLFSFQPAWYVNWGRFTQVASQAIVLVAWIMTFDAIRAWKVNWPEQRLTILWKTTVAAMLTAAVFLLHFRVAGFFLPLLAIAVAWELLRSRREKKSGRVLLGTAVVGVSSLVLVSPALWEALGIYLSTTLNPPVYSDELMQQMGGYFVFPWDSIIPVGAEWWMIALALLGAIIGLIRRNGLVLANVIWVAVLGLIGNAYWLRFKPLAFTNIGTIIIAMYLPIGLVIGAATEELLKFFRAGSRKRAANAMIGLVLPLACVGTYLRAGAIEEYRYFVTPADVAAMDWIRQNTPPDARFGINTMFWLPNFPYGTDAGYWIPYFTRRGTNTGAMLSSLAGLEEMNRMVTESRLVDELGTNAMALAKLEKQGVNYIYIGAKGNFAEPGLDAMRLGQMATVIYERSGVTILRLDAPLEK